ncbi:MAG: lumazine-binding family protein [Bradyrhizobium sp.]|nr:lumazine-binding family protein [Bradyrhizobium sp.]
MDAELEAMVRDLHDRQAIRDVIYTYCRGVDRMDRALLLSAYYPDAIDDHGLFVGGPEEFADWAFGVHGRVQYAHQHIVTNHLCEIAGNVAHSETYWMFAGMHHEGNRLTIGGGRYIDRMEKRAGQWKIAARKCVPDWGGVPGESWLSPEAAKALASSGSSARDKTDTSYERPLTIDPNRLGSVFSF